MLKSLDLKTRHSLRSGVSVASFAQCVDELVLNSLDAGSTCVAIRVDLNQGKVQVVDNGRGITPEELQVLGERYHTSKCSSLEAVERNLQHYGYRGEALASISHMSFMFEIETRSKTKTQTYKKLFREGKMAEIRESTIHRPSAGTTMTVYDLFHALPVRKKSLNQGLELERIRQRIEAIALIHPKISFSLRNDLTCTKILQTHKSNSIVGAFRHLYGNNKARVLKEVFHEDGDFKIHGYVGKDSHHNKSLQFVFINERFVLKSRIHKQVNQLLSKTIFMKKKPMGTKKDAHPQTSPEVMSPRRYAEKHGIFILNITCPLSAYDITFDPAKTLVEFKNWDCLLGCLREAVDHFIDENSLRNTVSSQDSQESADCVVISDSQDSQSEETSAKINFETCDITNSLQSKTVYRQRKCSEIDKTGASKAGCNDQGTNQSKTDAENLKSNSVQEKNGEVAGQAIVEAVEAEMTSLIKSARKISHMQEESQEVESQKEMCQISDQSPLAFMYKSSFEPSESKTETIDDKTSNRKSSSSDSNLYSEDPNLKVPSLPSQLLKSKSQRRNIHRRGSSSFAVSNSSTTKSENRSPFSLTCVKSKGSKSPADQIRMKYKKMYKQTNSPLAKESDAGVRYDAFDEDPLSAIRKSTNHYQNLSGATVPTVTSNHPLSSERKASVLSSLEQLRTRIKSKLNTQALGGTSSSVPLSKTPCKKHADASKHKRSSPTKPGGEKAMDVACDLEIVQFEELRNKLLGKHLCSADNRQSKTSTSSHENSVINSQTCCTNQGFMVKTVDKRGANIDLGSAVNDMSNCKVNNGATPTDVSRCLSNDEKYVKKPEVNRKRPLYLTPQSNNSIAAKLSRLSNTCNDGGNSINNFKRTEGRSDQNQNDEKINNDNLNIPSNEPTDKASTLKRFEFIPRYPVVHTVEESPEGPQMLSGDRRKYMTVTDYMTTPEEYDFDKALKSLGNSQTSQFSQHSTRDNEVNSESDSAKYSIPQRCFASMEITMSPLHDQNFSNSKIEKNYDDENGCKSSVEIVSDTMRGHSEYVVYENCVNDTIDIEQTPRIVPFPAFPIRLPSYSEMNKIQEHNLNQESNINQNRTSPSKIQENRLFCDDSPLSSDCSTEQCRPKSIERLPNNRERILEISNNTNVNSTKVESGENRKPISCTSRKQILLSEYDVEYIPLSQVDGIQYKKDPPSTEREPGKLITEKLQVNNFGNHDDCLPSTQGFDSFNETGCTQPFERSLNETQEFQHTTTEIQSSCIIDPGKSNDGASKMNEIRDNEADKDVGSTSKAISENDITEETIHAVQDWICKVDLNTGVRVYVNTNTGNSSFKLPQVKENSASSDIICGRNKAHLLTQNAGPFMKGDKVSTLVQSREDESEKSLADDQFTQRPDQKGSKLCIDESTVVGGLVEEHLEMQAEEDTVKWRNPDQCQGAQDSTVPSVTTMFSNWKNPMFSNPEQAVVNAEITARSRQAKVINNATNSWSFTKDMFESIKVLRQIDRKFIACTMQNSEENGGEMLIVIDQHAAHERIRLEKMTAGVFTDGNKQQILSCSVSPPVQLTLAEHYVRLLSAYKKQLSKFGVEFVVEDRDVVSIHIVPALMVERELTESKKICDPAYLPTQLELLIKEQIDALEKTRGGASALPLTIHKILCSRACKGAIKFGDKMTVDECEELIRQLSQCQLPFQCAHGRPSLMPLLDIQQLSSKLECEITLKPKLWKLRTQYIADK